MFYCGIESRESVDTRFGCQDTETKGADLGATTTLVHGGMYERVEVQHEWKTNWFFQWDKPWGVEVRGRIIRNRRDPPIRTG